MDAWFDRVPCGLWFSPQCPVVPRQTWRMPTCLVTGGRNTPSTPSSGISATQGLHNATLQWFAVRQTASGRNPRWNVPTVRALCRNTRHSSWDYFVEKEQVCYFLTIPHCCAFLSPQWKPEEEYTGGAAGVQQPAASSSKKEEEDFVTLKNICSTWKSIFHFSEEELKS